MTNYKQILCFSILCSTLGSPVFAQEIGVIGTLYPIAESDLRHVIQQRLQMLQQKGELETMQNQMRQVIQRQSDRPQPVIGIQRTTHANTRLFDPSVYFPYDIVNRAGNVVLPADTRVNPLTQVALPEPLLFYDANDAEQVKWAMHMDSLFKGQAKLILINGSIVNQTRLFNKPVFFDQNGRLTTRFQIQHVPAVVTQQGTDLKIQEVQP